MIISLDGNTYLGKTSIINEWKEVFSDSIICEEYDTELDVLEGKTHLQKQQYYFELEAKRLQCIKEDKVVFLDRSCLSMLAHSYAVSLIQSENLLIETIELLESRKEKGLIVCPEAVVFMIQPEEQRVYEDINQKGGEEILYDTLYRKYIDMFYKKTVGKIKDASLGAIYVCSKDQKEERERLMQWVQGHCIQDGKSDQGVIFDVLLSAVKEICGEMGIRR